MRSRIPQKWNVAAKVLAQGPAQSFLDVIGCGHPFAFRCSHKMNIFAVKDYFLLHFIV